MHEEGEGDLLAKAKLEAVVQDLSHAYKDSS